MRNSKQYRSNLREDVYKDLSQNEMSTSVTFASFLAAVSTFFVGALISRLGDTDYIIRVPVAYLIISMLGFLFAAVFYMNGVNLIKYQRERAKYCNNFATTIMEYFWVWFLVAAIPPTIAAITDDVFLQTITLSATIVSILLYEYANISITSYIFMDWRWFVSGIYALFVLMLPVSSVYPWAFVGISGSFIVYAATIAFLVFRNAKNIE